VTEHDAFDDDASDADDLYEDDLHDPVALHRAVQRRHRRRVRWAVALLVLVPLLVVGVFAGWVWWQLDPPGKPGAQVEVDITQGWGVSQIADELASRGVVGSSLVFQAYARLRGAGPFEPGQYEMRHDLGVRGAIDVLAKGPHIDTVNLAVIPGLRLTEIADVVEHNVSWLDGTTFLELAHDGSVTSPYLPKGTTTLEGLLWPDTYRVDQNEKEKELLTIMVQQFNKETTAVGLPTANVHGYGPYDIIKVASLVQSEAKLDSDRPKIASVIYNRLALGMPLQIDATVLYAQGKRGDITRADLATPSPYNTYTTKGLPPTPISSITLPSLLAAMHPADTPYLYYVIANKQGGHAFATTLQQHEANVARARAQGLL
jgi:UPF0755 protein